MKLMFLASLFASMLFIEGCLSNTNANKKAQVEDETKIHFLDINLLSVQKAFDLLDKESRNILKYRDGVELNIPDDYKKHIIKCGVVAEDIPLIDAIKLVCYTSGLNIGYKVVGQRIVIEPVEK